MWKSADRASSLRVIPWHLPYKKKARKNLSQGKKKPQSEFSIHITKTPTHTHTHTYTYTYIHPHTHTHTHTQTHKSTHYKTI